MIDSANPFLDPNDPLDGISLQIAVGIRAHADQFAARTPRPWLERDIDAALAVVMAECSEHMTLFARHFGSSFVDDFEELARLTIVERLAEISLTSAGSA